MKLSWEDYKDVIEGFFNKIFKNCKTIEDYESKNLTNQYIYELATEDNFYIKYFCDSLESYMRNYQKEYYNLKRGRNKRYGRCKECGKLFEKNGNRMIYCNDCVDVVRAKKRVKYNSDYYNKHIKNKQKIAKNIKKPFI